jgi:hypothetical protein
MEILLKKIYSKKTILLHMNIYYLIKKNYPKEIKEKRNIQCGIHMEGHNQLNIMKKKCIYIPCFCDPEKLEENIFIKENILHSSCLCIIPNNEEDIQKIINCLVDNTEFIKQNSSKRSGGWISMSSRILYQIPLQ